MGRLSLEGVSIRYADHWVVRDLSLSVADGEMVSLLGPSGAGKSTILKAVAGLLRPQAGEIRIDGRPVMDLPAEHRDAVMVFQKPLLFPFLDVFRNVGFGLRMRGRLSAEERRRILEILDLTGLAGLERRRIHELSGGQQQRVSLARALVLKPAILLLDEPLSNLDATLRQQMRDLIQEIQAETRITTLFVTHDQSEALMLSHRVGLLLDGRLRQVGAPRDLFHRPADPEVARFFGGANFFTARVTGGVFVSPCVRVPAPAAAGNGRERTATIRPEDVVILPEEKSNGEPGFRCRVTATRFEGIATRVRMARGDQTFEALADSAAVTPGQTVCIRFPPEKVRIFPDNTPETEKKEEGEWRPRRKKEFPWIP